MAAGRADHIWTCEEIAALLAVIPEVSETWVQGRRRSARWLRPMPVWTAHVATATHVGSYAAPAGISRLMGARSCSVTLRTDGSRRAFASNARHDGICHNGSRSAPAGSTCLAISGKNNWLGSMPFADRPRVRLATAIDLPLGRRPHESRSRAARIPSDGHRTAPMLAGRGRWTSYRVRCGRRIVLWLPVYRTGHGCTDRSPRRSGNSVDEARRGSVLRSETIHVHQ